MHSRNLHEKDPASPPGLGKIRSAQRDEDEAAGLGAGTEA